MNFEIKNYEDKRIRKEYFNNIIKLLKLETKCNILSSLYNNQTALIEFRYGKKENYGIYMLNDNGGEFTLIKVNTDQHFNIPYDTMTGINHEIHIMLMIKQYLKGEDIKYIDDTPKSKREEHLNVYKNNCIEFKL